MIKQNESELANTVFKIQSNKADIFFCFLLFVQSFTCLYLWNQLPNLCGFFTKLKPINNTLIENAKNKRERKKRKTKNKTKQNKTKNKQTNKQTNKNKNKKQTNKQKQNKKKQQKLKQNKNKNKTNWEFFLGHYSCLIEDLVMNCSNCGLCLNPTRASVLRPRESVDALDVLVASRCNKELGSILGYRCKSAESMLQTQWSKNHSDVSFIGQNNTLSMSRILILRKGAT